MSENSDSFARDSLPVGAREARSTGACFATHMVATYGGAAL